MNRRRLAAALPIGMLLLASPLLANCGAAKAGLAEANKATGGAIGGSCPDTKDVEAIMAFDFAKNFNINAEAGAKLKAGTAAAVELMGFADGVDADLKAACGGIAKDLGAAGEAKDGTEACNLAIKAMNDVKAKLGAKAQIAVNVKPPRCDADMNVMADCAAKCDAKLSGGKAKVECEPGKLSGQCDAKCEGTCDLKAAAKCEGECNGTCDAEVSGSCSGTCKGKCDGKNATGACAGKCEGKCEGGNVKGECKGKCGGSCQLKAQAQCDGTCTGKCSADFKEPKCTGEVKPPEMSADCKGHCDAKVNAKLDCKPAQVGVVVTGAADAKLADTFKATIEKNLPIILKLAMGMGDRAAKLAVNGKAVVEGVQASVTEIAKTSGNPAQAGVIGGKITACLGDTFKGAIAASGMLKADVDVSINVKASATASGSAGGSAGTK